MGTVPSPLPKNMVALLKSLPLYVSPITVLTLYPIFIIIIIRRYSDVRDGSDKRKKKNEIVKMKEKKEYHRDNKWERQEARMG